jgi:NADPH:quinone reductase-like Zn-dependent oxidoreductase
MRAARLIAHGQPPRLDQVAAPQRSEGQALLAVTAVPITPLDILCATGQSYFGAPALPYVPGVQGVGVVLESDTVPAGTRVWFPTSAGMAPGDGSLAERATASDVDLVPLPDGVDDELVAALGLSGVASWMAVTWRGQLRPGETVLVLGAGGVVGQVAVQVALLLGAGRVVAAARAEDSRKIALSYGAHAVVELGAADGPTDLAARMEAACEGPVDLVVDPLFGVPASAAGRVLAEGGRLVNLGSSAGATAEFDSATLRSRTASVRGYTNNALTTEQRRDALTALLAHAVEDGLTVGHEVLHWDDAPDGWSRQASGTARRRVVVRTDTSNAAE